MAASHSCLDMTFLRVNSSPRARRLLHPEILRCSRYSRYRAGSFVQRVRILVWSIWRRRIIVWSAKEYVPIKQKDRRSGTVVATLGCAALIGCTPTGCSIGTRSWYVRPNINWINDTWRNNYARWMLCAITSSSRPACSGIHCLSFALSTVA